VKARVLQGDCINVMRSFPDNSIDAIVTDPPYGLGKEPDPRKVLSAWLNDEAYQAGGSGFMNRKWDAFVPSPVVWMEALRVLKPGGHLLCFAGTRTQDWMMLALRMAGFQIRDVVMWLNGQGFPKSQNASKSLDRAAGELGTEGRIFNVAGGVRATAPSKGYVPPAPVTEDAQRYEGYGTALKPAYEPIIVARKPLIGRLADNLTEYGTGALNIDDCRVPTDENPSGERRKRGTSHLNGTFGNMGSPEMFTLQRKGEAIGRWPANIMHDGSPEAVGGFPDTGVSAGGSSGFRKNAVYGSYGRDEGFEAGVDPGFGDSGSAARYFYCAKASIAEKEAGLEHREGKRVTDGRSKVNDSPRNRDRTVRKNPHPTVKPLDLMRWCVRLVMPPDEKAILLDPFAGSGSTLCAAVLEGVHAVGIELDEDYCSIVRDRVKCAKAMVTWANDLANEDLDEEVSVTGCDLRRE